MKRGKRDIGGRDDGIVSSVPRPHRVSGPGCCHDGPWVLQLRVRNASIADVGWCAGLIAVVLWYAIQATGETERKLLVAALAVLYAGRLGFFIFLNRVIGKKGGRSLSPSARAGLAVNAESACYRHLASTNWQDNSSPT